MLRNTILRVVVASGFALAAPRGATAQDAVPRKPDAAFKTVREYYEQPQAIPANELKPAQEAFAAFAKYFADSLTHPALWRASQDVKVEVPQGLFPSLDGDRGMLRELDRFLLKPVTGGEIGPTKADYVRELGAALDAALKPLIAHPEPIVRVNACRVLAHVARSGAPAHYETITTLLADPKTATELKHYLLQAAGAVLSAADPTEIKVRKHSGTPKAVGALVKALEGCVTDPAMLIPDFKADAVTNDQLVVLAFVRRQAVKALGQVKFATLPGPDGKTPIYPAYTLARVALGDPALLPASRPGEAAAEAAEAVIGLCNMQPPAKGFNAPLAVEAISAGLNTFATPRATNVNDRSLPWRSYSLRIAEGLRNLRLMFNPEFDPLQPSKKFDDALIPAPFEELYKEVLPKVLAPIEKVDAGGKPDSTATVEVEKVLRERLKAFRADPNRSKTLFEGAPATSLESALSK
jgi:hypothetical protein